MAWAVLLCLCSWWRWCRGSRLWSLFLFSSVVASSLCFCHLVFFQTILYLSLSRFPLLFPFLLFCPSSSPLKQKLSPLFLLLCKPPLSPFSNLFLPSLFCSSSSSFLKSFAPSSFFFFFSFLQLACLPLLFPFFSPHLSFGTPSSGIYRQRRRGSPYPVQAQGMVAGAWISCFSINEGMGCVSS